MADSTTASDGRVMELVEAALGQPEGEREAFLRSACGNDADLFQTVWSRVRRMNDFLLAPLFSPALEPEPFRPGDVLLNRFRLIRQVGGGGMGIVYEAIDERLNRRIAIKCARPGYQRRLPPEARNATTISHPNVCKTYEIHTAATAQGEVDFLTMEYLEGETLSDRLRRPDRPGLEEGRSVALQLCRGLEEAHRSGVIHGDLKSGNVILVARAGGGTRAVITDFGLARQTTGPAPGGIQASHRGGTPAYMAPELWRGETSSIASDIFALGVMLYEIFGGRRPFPDDSGPRFHLDHKPKPLGRLVRHVPRRLDRTVLHCLADDPSHRPTSAGQVAAHIKSRGPNWRVAAVACLAALVAVIGGLRSPAPARDPVRMALLPFDTAETERALYEGVLLETSNLLRDNQATGSGFFVIPVGESIARHVTTPADARRLLGATHVLHATLEEAGATITVHAGVMDTASLRDLKQPVSLEYTRGELSHMPGALAGIVTGCLGLSPASVADTVNSAAYQDYTAGLASLQHDAELGESIRRLERAVRSDPGSALTHAALADAYRRKYSISRESRWLAAAADALRKAEAINPDRARVRLAAGNIRLEEGQFARAVDDFSRAAVLGPHDSEPYQQMAVAYHAMARDQEALDAHLQAIKLQPNYYRPYQELGGFYYDSAQYEKAAEQFRKVVGLIPAWPESHYALAAAYAKAGRYAEAEAECRVALKLDENFVSALVTLGSVLIYQGRDAEAIPYYKKAADLSPSAYLSWLNLGDVYQRSRQGAEAARAYRRGLELAREEVTRRPQAAYDRGCVAYLLARLGQRREAEYEISQALALPVVDEQARRMAVRTYEALGQRDRALSVLSGAPLSLIKDVGNAPGMADLRRDPRYLELVDERKPN